MPTPLPATGTALLLIDVQQALFQPAPRPHEADAVIARINALAAQARAAGVPVLWVQHETVPGHRLAHGSPGWALADGLQVAADDVAFRKTTPDSFLRTALADWLAVRHITRLVVAGYASEFCIDTTTTIHHPNNQFLHTHIHTHTHKPTWHLASPIRLCNQ